MSNQVGQLAILIINDLDDQKLMNNGARDAIDVRS
ncbi:MAG: hypothetical protein ACI83D_000281 [Planctomycetota bacterium]|jgi:hypothetical protein